MDEQRLNLAILSAFTVFFTLAAIVVAVWLPANDKLFAFVSGTAQGFGGALLLMLRSGLAMPAAPPAPPAADPPK
jgi:hypothetical protein